MRGSVLITACLALAVNGLPQMAIFNASSSEAGNVTVMVTPTATTAVSVDFNCLVCQWGANILIEYANKGRTIDNFLSMVATLCHFFKIESKEVCAGMVRIVGSQMFDIIRDSHGKITPKDICGMVEEGQCAKRSPRMSNWRLDIPDLDQPSPVPVPVLPSKDRPKQKILHLSDPHVQRDYLVGSNTNCGQPMCCSAANGFLGKDVKGAAALTGDFNCDLPPWTMDAMIREVRSAHPDINYVFLTGDYPAHDIWRQNRTLNMQSSAVVAEIMQKHFGDIPVMMAIGNHESYPVNMFPDVNETGKYNPGWLYGGMADLYKHWLPGESQQRTLKQGGYYSQLLRPGLRVVSINSNVCNNLNFFLLSNFNDPSQHLHWVYRQLHKAELNKEKVYIISHIPPGRNSCFNQWSHEYNRLIRRFNNTVLAQFFGHTHFDEYEVFHSDKAPFEPVAVGYIAPSLTPHGGINSAYRIYEIDGDYPETSNLILDHETHYFDLVLSIANNNTLVRVKEYSAQADLGMTSLSASSWHDLAHRMAGDEELFKRFLGFYYHEGPAKDAGCDAKCKRTMLCDLLTSESGDEGANCGKLYELLDESRSNGLSFWDYFWS